MRVNKTNLEVIFKEDNIFKTIDENFQRELIKAIDSHTYNLKLVVENKLALYLLKYLTKNLKLEISGEDQQSLMYYLQLVAALNKRKEIHQSDLYMLRKLNLEIENWQTIIKNAVGKMMFREYYLYLDQNATFKDQLTVDFYNKSVSANQVDLAHDIIKWLENGIDTLEQSESSPTENEQLTNRFYQQEIYLFYHEQLNLILQIMNFQLRAFKLIDSHTI